MRNDSSPSPDVDAATAARRRRGFLLGLGAALIWGGYLGFARAGVVDGLRPEDFVLLRFGVASIVMLPYLVWRGVKDLAGVGWGRGVVMALCAGPFFMLLIPAGFMFAPLAHGAVIPPSSTTVSSMILAAIVLRDRPSPTRILAVGMILAGLVCIAGSGFFAETGRRAWIGDLMFAAAGFLWAIFTVLQMRWRIGPMQATTAIAIVSLVMLLPPYLLWSGFDRLLALPAPMLAAQIVIQGVLAGAVAVVAYSAAAVALGASRAALFPALVPGTAILVGIPMTGEWPTPLQWIGVVIVIAGLATALGLRIRRRAGR